MNRTRSVLATVFVPVTALACAAVPGLSGPSGAAASTATTSLCGRYDTKSVSDGAYVVQNNEYNSSASECLDLGRGTRFSVGESRIKVPSNGSPGAYPSLFTGSSWGHSSAGGLAASPVRVSALGPGTALTSWSTTQPYQNGEAYDAAYDIWINPTPAVSGQPRGSEVMIWLNHKGGIRPIGRRVAAKVSIGGRSYEVWYEPPSGNAGDIVSYVMSSPVTSVSGLDLGRIFRNSVSRGYTKPSWYLVAVEAGFELWRGGTGLTSNWFSVRVR
jgi:cellulose 1,4-beta-cellobiosidase